MTRKYLVEGRIIPERVAFDCPLINLGCPIIKLGNIRVKIVKSKIFIIIEFENEYSIPDLRNILFSVVGNIVNYCGFMLTTAMSYELESIVNMNTNEITVFGAEGFVFDNTDEFGDKIQFKPSQLGAPLELNLQFAMNPIVSRATFELRNSIRYPDFTAMHCRLAIEAIRNAFCDDFDAKKWEDKAWIKMRETLNISRETIESFKEIATNQRHGQDKPQTWEQRRNCMQIAWEALHRFMKYKSRNYQQLSGYPEL